MNELAIRQQQTVDRIALIGSSIAILFATAFVTLDPIQTVARPLTPLAAPAAPTVPVSAPERSPLVQLSLPSPAWTVVADGTWAAYARLEKGEPAEVVARNLHTDEWRVVYRAGSASFLGQLSLAKGVLVLEEVAQPNGDAHGRTMAVRAVSVATGAVTTVDSFAPTASLASSPVTDGSRVLWVRPALGGGDEIRALDLASGNTRALYRDADQIAGLAVSGDTLAFSVLDRTASKSYVLDLASAALTTIDGFAYAYVQSVGPAGVIVTAAAAPDAPAGSWLVKRDGARTRLASDCFNVTITERVLAMRCATQIEIRDLATASSLYRFAGNAGALAVFDGGVAWGEGDELLLYELPALPAESRYRPN